MSKNCCHIVLDLGMTGEILNFPEQNILFAPVFEYWT